jgi:EXS family
MRPIQHQAQLQVEFGGLTCRRAALPLPESTLDVYNGVWVALYITSSLYSFWWDAYQDWGLGDRKHGWLSERRMHGR